MSFSCPRTASSTFGSVSRLIRNPSCFDCSSNATRKNRNSRSRTINNHTNSIKCSSTIVAVTDVRRKARDSKPDVENIPGRFDDATIRVFELVRVVRGVVVAVEVPACDSVSAHRIDRQEPSDLRVVVALLHVAQSGRSITQIGRETVLTQ